MRTIQTWSFTLWHQRLNTSKEPSRLSPSSQTHTWSQRKTKYSPCNSLKYAFITSQTDHSKCLTSTCIHKQPDNFSFVFHKGKLWVCGSVECVKQRYSESQRARWWDAWLDAHLMPVVLERERQKDSSNRAYTYISSHKEWGRDDHNALKWENRMKSHHQNFSLSFNG